MQTFGVIPAAGRSERMGRAKLLLPWGQATVIEHVLGVWRASGVSRVVMVVHPQDDQLAKLGRGCGADIVQPDVPPAEMKVSVQHALRHVASEYRPEPLDAWLLAPADMPTLSAEVIRRLMDVYERSASAPSAASSIWVPSFRGRRGHPVLFPWSLAPQVANLGREEGINALLSRNVVMELDSPDDSICDDLDTPDDYERLSRRHLREGS